MRPSPLAIQRGEPFTLPVIMTVEGLDFTDVTLTAQVRENAEAGLLATPTVSITSAGVGELQATVTMTTAQTAVLTDRCVLFVRAARTSPAWGPHTVPAATLHVTTPGVR